MFKYIQYEKVETEYTVLEFRGGDEDVKVNHFADNVVSIQADSEEDIDSLVNAQPLEIKTIYLTQEEFKKVATESPQLNRIRDRIKEQIALKYSLADEIAMSKRADDDEKKIAYESYVNECLSFGAELKAKVGY